MGKDKSKKKDKDKGKGKGKDKGKGKGKHGNKVASKFKNMSTGKKVMIGTGVAALAIGATAGGLYLAKRHKNKGQHGKLLDEHGTRGISNLGALQYVDDPKTSMQTIPAPDAITVGLCWDTQQSGQANLDLLASVYNGYGQNMGYIQGSFNRDLFNGAIWHSGDDVKGGAKSDLTSLTGDNEDIVIDFLKVPHDATCIMIGALLVQAQSQLSRASVHIAPLLRADQVESSGIAHRGIQEEEESDDSDDSDDSSPEVGHRGITGGSEADDELVKIFQADLENFSGFPQQRGFVAGRLLRTGPQSWSWTPIRQVVQADPQSGIWPTLEYYGKPA